MSENQVQENEVQENAAGGDAAGDEAHALLVVRDLAKSYGELEVLRGVSFDLEAGDSLAVLGRSGSGKSVTLRQLNGLEVPDEGSVLFDGMEITELSERELIPVRQRLAMLFQGGALFDSMTVFENIAFSMREHTDWDEERIEAEVERKLEMVRLPGIDEKMPSDLSGGMRKRVALARSLALDPELVLYDEPTTGLDPVTSSAIAQLIQHTRDELGMTTLMVTHDLPLARRAARRIAFLHEGSFRFLGTWEEAESTDDELVTNFLEGRAEIEDAA